MSGSLVRMCSSTRMPPRSPIVEAGRLGQGCVRLHADGQDHDVRRIRLPGTCLNLDGAPVQLLEADHAVVGDNLHAMTDDMLLDEDRDLRVQRGQYVIGLLDECHVESGMDQIFRRLETDEAAADHDRAPHRLHHLDARVFEHSRQKRRAAFDPLTDRPRVRHGPHMKDPRQIDSGQGRMHRSCSGRQHQLIVGLGRDLAGRYITKVHGLVFRRNGDRLAVGPHVDPEVLAEQLLTRDQ